MLDHAAAVVVVVVVAAAPDRFHVLEVAVLVEFAVTALLVVILRQMMFVAVECSIFDNRDSWDVSLTIR